MKVICDRAALLEAVGLVSGVVVSRTPTPVLQCIKFTAADGILTLAATDLEVGLRMSVEQVDVERPGEALVPADKLNQIVRSWEGPTIMIETEDHTTRLRGPDSGQEGAGGDGSGSDFKIFGFDPREAPVVRDLGDAVVDCEIQAGMLQQLVQRTLFAAAAEHSRYAINGVLFDREERRLRMVATDGRRLAMARGDCQNTGEKKQARCIVPTTGLAQVAKLLGDSEAPVRMAIEENQVIFAVGEGPTASVLSSNLVEGTFPPFEDVIPKDQDKRVSFDSAVLSRAIRRAALLTNEESRGVRMSFEPGRLTLSSRAPEMGEAKIDLKLEEYEGEPVDIGFNPGFITDALKVVDGKQIIIELKAPNKPGVIRTDGGQEFTYVVMPVNLQ
jgi:DNA polymerase-3 subunit beta